MKYLILLLFSTLYAVEPHIFPVNEFRIIDGDTVEVIMDLGFDLTKKTSVRIVGVNAPEKTGNEKVAGLAVTAEVSTWLTGYTIYCKYEKEDKYGGRIDGDIIRSDGQRLSKYLIDNGYAKIYDGTTSVPRFTDDEINVIIKKINEKTSVPKN